MKIENARALVTGGASGLGEGVVRLLSAHGASVTIIDLESSKGAQLAQELGPRVTFASCDVTDSAQVERAIALATESMGTINANINCAGISPA